MTNKTSLEYLIVQTLAYSDIFDYPLLKHEILRRLPKVSVSEKEFSLILDKLVKQGLIDNYGHWFYLPKKQWLVNKCQYRKKLAEKKITKLKQVIALLKLIPFVEMIGLTGSVAVGNAQKNDDVDLFIIASQKRLWLTRFIVTLIVDLMGKRRRPGQIRFKDKLCLNMFLDRSALKISKKKRNLYTAYEIFQLRPLFNQNMTYEKFIYDNFFWLKKYLPNVNWQDLFNDLSNNQNNKFNGGNLSYFLNKLEDFFFWFQKKYMNHKIINEDIGSKKAFFHPVDKKKLILDKLSIKMSNFNFPNKKSNK